MKRTIAVVFAFFLLFSISVFNNSVVGKGETNETGFTVKMSVTYRNNGTKNWTLTDEERAVGLFMNNTWQTVQLTNHAYPIGNSTFDEDGNPIAILQFPVAELKPGENISYAVTYNALSKPRLLPNIIEEDSGTLTEIPEELKENYSRGGDPWLVDDPELRDLAHIIAGNETNVLTLVKNFVSWIKRPEGIAYEIHEVPYYPNETLAGRKGDCDDQAIPLITLLRIYGIPAHLQIGSIYLPTNFDDRKYWDGHVRSVLKRVAWHDWAMVYIPPWRWLPVDLTYTLDRSGDALDAIRKAAVTSQTTFQHMNISQMDYVASAREEKNFLKNNGFYIDTQDEMIEAPPTSPWDVIT